MLESHSARETLLAKSTPQGFPFLRKICIFALSVGFILLATQSIQQKMGAKSPEISISGWTNKQWQGYELPPNLHQQYAGKAKSYGWKDIKDDEFDRAHIVPKSWIPRIWNNLKPKRRIQFATLIIGPNKQINQMDEGDLIWGEGNVRLGLKDQNNKIQEHFDPVFVEDQGKYKFDDNTRNMLVFLSSSQNWNGGFVTVINNLWYMKPLIESRMIQSSGRCETIDRCLTAVDIDDIKGEDQALLKKIWDLPEFKYRKVKEGSKEKKPEDDKSKETPPVEKKEQKEEKPEDDKEDKKSKDGEENTDPHNQAPASSSSSDPSNPRAKNT